jgi:hypothetical protein
MKADGSQGVHLLDDGFQHRGLARAVDVVLVTAEDLEDALLPAGNRRETLSGRCGGRMWWCCARRSGAGGAAGAAAGCAGAAGVDGAAELRFPEAGVDWRGGAAGGVLRDCAAGGFWAMLAKAGLRVVAIRWRSRPSSVYAEDMRLD